METQTERQDSRIHPDRRWINYREAGILTGLSRSTISRIVNANRVEYVRWGRTVKINRGSLEELLEAGGDLRETQD